LAKWSGMFWIHFPGWFKLTNSTNLRLLTVPGKESWICSNDYGIGGNGGFSSDE